MAVLYTGRYDAFMCHVTIPVQEIMENSLAFQFWLTPSNYRYSCIIYKWIDVIRDTWNWKPINILNTAYQYSLAKWCATNEDHEWWNTTQKVLRTTVHGVRARPVLLSTNNQRNRHEWCWDDTQWLLCFCLYLAPTRQSNRLHRVRIPFIRRMLTGRFGSFGHHF